MASAMNSLSSFLEKHPNLEPTSNPLVLIPTFNNGVYLQNCISQLDSLGLSGYLILDGGSTEVGTVKMLRDLNTEGRVIELPHNPGPRFFFEDKSFYSLLPEIFCVTDPDLQFNEALPRNFLSRLLLLSEELDVGKVGFALSLDGDISTEEFFTGGKWTRIADWEKQFWREKISNSIGLEAYRAPIDTTFALYNKKYLNRKSFFRGVRVAGDFVAEHLPWYPRNELCRKAQTASAFGPHSTWSVELSRERERAALKHALNRIALMESSVSWRITAPFRMLHKMWKIVSRASSGIRRH